MGNWWSLCNFGKSPHPNGASLSVESCHPRGKSRWSGNVSRTAGAARGRSCRGVHSYVPADPSKQPCSYGRSRTRQDPRLEHIVGPCREGLAPVACTDPERSSWSSAWGAFSEQPTAPDPWWGRRSRDVSWRWQLGGRSGARGWGWSYLRPRQWAYWRLESPSD